MDDQNLDFKDDIISHPSKVALLLTVVLHVGAHYLLENPLQSLAQALAFDMSTRLPCFNEVCLLFTVYLSRVYLAT